MGEFQGKVLLCYHSGPAPEDSLENLWISKFLKGNSPYPRAIIYSSWPTNTFWILTILGLR